MMRICRGYKAIIFFMLLCNSNSYGCNFSCIEDKKEEIKSKRMRLEAIGSICSKTKNNDVMDIDALIAEHNKTRNIWRDRKSNLMEVVDMLAEGMEKKTTVIMVRLKHRFNHVYMIAFQI
jgi:hypothetical protein